jgi:transposase
MARREKLSDEQWEVVIEFLPKTVRRTDGRGRPPRDKREVMNGIFTSVADLKRKLMRYIRQYNTRAKPVKWKYFDPSRRITPDSIVTVH